MTVRIDNELRLELSTKKELKQRDIHSFGIALNGGKNRYAYSFSILCNASMLKTMVDSLPKTVHFVFQYNFMAW